MHLVLGLFTLVGVDFHTAHHLVSQAASEGGCGDPKSGILLMVMIFAIFWLIVFRPQQKRMKEQQRFLDNLQKGQEVVTQGGLIGKITGFKGSEVILEVQEKVRVRILRANVASTYPPPARGGKSAVQAPDKAADRPEKGNEKGNDKASDKELAADGKHKGDGDRSSPA